MARFIQVCSSGYRGKRKVPPIKPTCTGPSILNVAEQTHLSIGQPTADVHLKSNPRVRQIYVNIQITFRIIAAHIVYKYDCECDVARNAGHSLSSFFTTAKWIPSKFYATIHEFFAHFIIQLLCSFVVWADRTASHDSVGCSPYVFPPAQSNSIQPETLSRVSMLCGTCRCATGLWYVFIDVIQYNTDGWWPQDLLLPSYS